MIAQSELTNSSDAHFLPNTRHRCQGFFFAVSQCRYWYFFAVPQRRGREDANDVLSPALLRSKTRQKVSLDSFYFDKSVLQVWVPAGEEQLYRPPVGFLFHSLPHNLANSPEKLKTSGLGKLIGLFLAGNVYQITCKWKLFRWFHTWKDKYFSESDHRRYHLPSPRYSFMMMIHVGKNHIHD